MKYFQTKPIEEYVWELRVIEKNRAGWREGEGEGERKDVKKKREGRGSLSN